MPLGFYPLHHFTATAATAPPLYPFSSTLSSPSLFDSVTDARLRLLLVVEEDDIREVIPIGEGQ
jgi:hypothetical protein